MIRARPLLLLLITLLIACGGGGGMANPRPAFNVLTAEEMQARQYTTLYDAILALRANWLRERPPASYDADSPERAQVFRDGMRVGTVEFLRQLQPGDVDSVRYLTVTEAVTEFGRLALATPAIVITMKRGP